MSDMKLYAQAIFAPQISGQNALSVIYSTAHTEDEATGLALRWGREKFPSSQGYYGHTATVVEVLPDFLEKNLGLIKKQ